MPAALCGSAMRRDSSFTGAEKTTLIAVMGSPDWLSCAGLRVTAVLVTDPANAGPGIPTAAASNKQVSLFMGVSGQSAIGRVVPGGYSMHWPQAMSWPNVEGRLFEQAGAQMPEEQLSRVQFSFVKGRGKGALCRAAHTVAGNRPRVCCPPCAELRVAKSSTKRVSLGLNQYHHQSSPPARNRAAATGSEMNSLLLTPQNRRRPVDLGR